MITQQLKPLKNIYLYICIYTLNQPKGQENQILKQNKLREPMKKSKKRGRERENHN